MLLARHGGTEVNRRVWVTKSRGLRVSSCHIFNAFEEPSPINIYDLREWLPRPTQEIRRRVWDFQRHHFSRTVGMHIRRTDKRSAIIGTPDKLYLDAANELVNQGFNIFLATDNARTRDMMVVRYKDKIISYPKTNEMNARWPRRFNLDASLEDLVDMHLLAACEFVIGSAFSSYSMLAVLYNGSPRSKLMSRRAPSVGKAPG